MIKYIRIFARFLILKILSGISLQNATQIHSGGEEPEIATTKATRAPDSYEPSKRSIPQPLSGLD